MIMAQSLLKLRRQRYPDQPVDLLAPAWSLPVIERMPEVRDGIVLPAGHGEIALGKRRALGRELRGRGYAAAIVLPRSMKAALVPWFAGIPRRTGYRGEMRYGIVNDRRPFDRGVLDQTVKRFVALGLEPGEALPPLPEPRLEVSAGAQAAALGRLGLDGSRPAVAMMPGAEYGPAKCWPLEYFTELAARLDAEGYAVHVFGSAKERELGAAIAAGSRARNLCGETTLAEAIDLIGACRHAVSNDSGLMHMAAAVGSHVIGLYGSTTPDFTPPLTENRTLHYLRLDCSPCFRRECPLGHLRCLREIRPGDVLDSVLAKDRENESK